MTPTPEMPKADRIESPRFPGDARWACWKCDGNGSIHVRGLTAIERYAQQQAAEAQQQRERAEKAGADMEEYRKIVREIGDRLGGVESNTKLIVGILNMVTKERDTLREENRRLREAMTPSEGTKAAYMHEFSVPFPEIDEDGDEVIRQVNVPWTTIKKVMAKILDRALTPEPKEGITLASGPDPK